MSNQITTLRMPDGREVQFVDWQDMPIYSTADLLTGFTDEEIYLFTYTEGDPVAASSNATQRRIASRRDTNVAAPGAAAGTEEMLVYAIKPSLTSLTCNSQSATDLTTAAVRSLGQPIPRAVNIAQLDRHCTLQLKVSENVMHEAGFGYYNPGFGAAGSVMADPGAASAVRSYGTSGLPSQEAVRSFGIPIHVGGDETYDVKIVNHAQDAVTFYDEADEPAEITGAVIRACVYLDGLYKRPVA
jgi:hypothetical protein